MAEIAILTVGLFISGISTLIIMKHRPSEVQKWFILASVCIFVYMFANFTKRHSDQETVVLLMQELIYTCTSLAYTGFVMGLADVCEVKIPTAVKDALISFLTFMCTIYMTIHLHDHFYSSAAVYPDPANSGLFISDLKENWLYYVLVAGYSNILLLAMIIFLLIGIFRKKGSKAAVVRLLLVSMLLSVVPLFLRLLGIMPNAVADHVSFIISNVFMLFLIHRYDVMTTLPLIKEAAVETSQDGIVITDSSHYFRYANDTAKKIFSTLGGDDPDRITGFVANALTDGTRERNGRMYEIRTDEEIGGDQIQGYITVIRDITEHDRRIRAEEEIRTAVEREKNAAEMTLAAKIQMSMMPHDFPPYPDRGEFDIYALMHPARDVGGDFYDFFLIDEDHLCIAIADVSGKGVPASLFMMISNVILRSCAMLGRRAAEILNETNKAICSKNEMEMFLTVWLGILEISTGRLTAANAGHEYPAVTGENGRFELYKDKHGLVIGGMDGVKYREYEIMLRPGDKIFVYTDGVPEAANSSNEMFGTQRLLTALNMNPAARPERAITNVRSAVSAFVRDAEQFDDITMLCLEYKGTGESAPLT
ncbi:MAG: SpoIIE family protein phosphatase [Oscillospiraceae bacterium]|nr:SpoIIE family protein phosphatase [Oscillospiraceae bacterium]